MIVDQGHFRSDKILAHYPKIEFWLENGYTPAPITLELDVTNECNARCPDCAGGRAVPHAQWDFQPGELFTDIKNSGVKAVIFTGGGEPTLHPHLADYIYAAAQEGLEVGLISNGILLREKVAEAVIACCTWIRFSLAANAEVWSRQTGVPTAVFVSVLENIRTVTSRRWGNLQVGIAVLTDKTSMYHLRKAVETAYSVHASYIQFRPAHYDTTQLDWAELIQLQAEYRGKIAVSASWHKYKNMGGKRSYDECLGHHFAGVVQADFRMTTCCHTRGIDAFSWGNICTGLVDNWFSPERIRAAEKIDLSQCVPLCRNDPFNQTLWELKRDKGIQHVNFL